MQKKIPKLKKTSKIHIIIIIIIIIHIPIQQYPTVSRSKEVPPPPRRGERGAGLVVPPRPAPGRFGGHQEVGEVPAMAAEVPCPAAMAGRGCFKHHLFWC